MNNYVVYSGTYTKQNGDRRTMRFVHTTDLPTDLFADFEPMRSLNIFLVNTQISMKH